MIVTDGRPPGTAASAPPPPLNIDATLLNICAAQNRGGGVGGGVKGIIRSKPHTESTAAACTWVMARGMIPASSGGGAPAPALSNPTVCDFPDPVC